MRQSLAARYGVHRDSPDWPAFVNNHAWALVRRQRELSDPQSSISATTGSRSRPTTTKPGEAITSVDNGSVLAAVAETLRNRANQVNRDGGRPETLSREDMVELWRRCGRPMHC